MAIGSTCIAAATDRAVSAVLRELAERVEQAERGGRERRGTTVPHRAALGTQREWSRRPPATPLDWPERRPPAET